MKTFKHTKIIATHDLDMVLYLYEGTIVIHKGRVTVNDSATALFKNKELLHLEIPMRMQGCPICGNEKEIRF